MPDRGGLTRSWALNSPSASGSVASGIGCGSVRGGTVKRQRPTAPGAAKDSTVSAAMDVRQASARRRGAGKGRGRQQPIEVGEGEHSGEQAELDQEDLAVGALPECRERAYWASASARPEPISAGALPIGRSDRPCLGRKTKPAARCGRLMRQ